VIITKTGRTALYTSCLLLLLAIATLSAPTAKPPRVGVPQDWSQRHLIFNRRALIDHPELARMEPRLLFQMMRQSHATADASGRARDNRDEPASGPQRDWNVPLGTGHIAFGMSPAKFGFDPNSPPSCTGDYVAFGLNVTGTTGGQASIVAYNNLYSGTGGFCGTGDPSVLFAYNTTTAGGRILTSPVLSLDGTQIAFVESSSSSSVFHVLKWATGTGNGTSATNSAAPGVGNTASITSLTYAPAASNLHSAPWIDYINDVAYVAADDGKLYKIAPVFTGTPALAGAPWPVTVAAGRRLTAPVLDQATLNIFIGDSSGFLWQVSTTSPGTLKSLAVGSPGKRNTGILDGPLVDASDGTVFATSSNDGTSAVVVQADTATLTQMTRARIGLGSAGTPGANVNVYDGAFNDNYYTLPASGYLFACGTGAADTTPWRYFFGFTGVKMNSSPSRSMQILNSTRSRCSPLTEFFNQNVGASGTDFFFWGMTADCTGTNTAGCIYARTNFDVVTTVNEVGGTSVITTDNNSTLGQASSVYFTNQGNANQGIKLTQNGLQ
jgi:hypothetical protein